MRTTSGRSVWRRLRTVTVSISSMTSVMVIPLSQVLAGVDAQRLAGDARRGGEENDGTGDVIGLDELAEERLGERGLFDRWRDLLGHRRAHPARLDRVHADAEAPGLAGDALHQSEEPGLARRVRGGAGLAARAVD